MADAAADLDLRLQELGLDLVLEDHTPFVEELLDVGGQLAGVGVDDLVLLLDTECQRRQGHKRLRGRGAGSG